MSSERCYVCGGSGRRSSFVLAVGHEIEGECPDCEGTGVLNASALWYAAHSVLRMLDSGPHGLDEGDLELLERLRVTLAEETRS